MHEDEDKTMKHGEDWCGCDCEACMRGDHHHCESGLCRKKGQEPEKEDD